MPVSDNPVYVIVDTPTARLFRRIFLMGVALVILFFILMFVSVLCGGMDYKNPPQPVATHIEPADPDEIIVKVH